MGKKKFIDKKKAATFCLLSRDSSDPIYAQGPENDRVFVRVDNNSVSISGMNEGENESDYTENDPNSIFADADDDDDDVECNEGYRGHFGMSSEGAPLPDHVRREILELGFPDDGYNYLTHLREIRNTGGGSAFYENPKANLRDVPDDVKAYDASRVRVNQVAEDTNLNALYSVAEKSVNVRVQKVVDPEVAKLLDEAESEFGSDIDDLEEDFVVKANLILGSGDAYYDESSTSVSKPQGEVLKKLDSSTLHAASTGVPSGFIGDVGASVPEKPRVPRLIDQEFDLVERQEYGTDSDDEYDDFGAEEDISITEKLSSAFKDQKIDDFEFDEHYRAPADDLHDQKGIKDENLVNSAAEIVRRCVEYAEGYENGYDDKDLVIEEESSDESEAFDCETIVSTYSNLDNHPGLIGAPGFARKKRLSDTLFGALNSGSDNIISLGGKEKLPVDYLRSERKATKEKTTPVAKAEPPKRKPHGQESKEEKKERKAAVKEGRREARRVKKEMKGLYRDESTRAQKVAAVSGPSSYHIR